MLQGEELKQKIYYDSISSEYDSHYASESALFYRTNVYERFVKGIELKGLKVLDAMSGGGQNSVFFISKGSVVTAVDISEGQCQNYKNRFPNNKIVCASILESGLPDSSFDLIVSESLHHLHPHVDACMEEFNRLLKPNGLLMLWEPSAGSIFDSARKLWYKLDNKYFEDNEASIDLTRLEKDNSTKFELVRKRHGGNVGYLFLNLTMALRLKSSNSNLVRKILLFLEFMFWTIQGRWNSLWFLALFRKK